MKVQTERLAGFLDCVSFDFFCTFTTRLPISLYSTRKIAERVYKQITNQNLWGASVDETSYFWCAEPFDVREGYHFHALLKAKIDKMQLYDWFSRKYGICQLIDNREPDRQLAASYYCSKYLTKNLSDYDIYIGKKHRFPEFSTFYPHSVYPRPQN